MEVGHPIQNFFSWYSNSKNVTVSNGYPYKKNTSPHPCSRGDISSTIAIRLNWLMEVGQNIRNFVSCYSNSKKCNGFQRFFIRTYWVYSGMCSYEKPLATVTFFWIWIAGDKVSNVLSNLHQPVQSTRSGCWDIAPVRWDLVVCPILESKYWCERWSDTWLSWLLLLNVGYVGHIGG